MVVNRGKLDGAGSGGGSINIFYRKCETQDLNSNVNGGRGGSNAYYAAGGNRRSWNCY